jgi:hypothetical protein
MAIPTRTAADAGLPSEDVPCCWLCLEEGQDESGAPLVRDCSCRGTSGFAHLSCIVGYAENKGRQVRTKTGVRKLFEKCPGCNQQYQNSLKRQLRKAQLEFVERGKESLSTRFTKSELNLLHARALKIRLDVLNGQEEEDRREGEEICSKLLILFEEINNDGNPENYQKMEKALTYSSMGDFHFRIGSETLTLGKAKEYEEKALAIYQEMGDEFYIMISQANIDTIEAEMSGKQFKSSVGYWRKVYDFYVDKAGANHPHTITRGTELADALFISLRTIEAERLLSKLVASSHLVHGTNHPCTQRAVEAQTHVEKRRVIVVSKENELFQILRHENDGKECVVSGPVPKRVEERNLDQEQTYTVANTDIILVLGTPVICHGLEEEEAHLNGKIGDVRSVSEDYNVYRVHFEEEGLGPTEVKMENLRVVFELPPVDSE